MRIEDLCQIPRPGELRLLNMRVARIEGWNIANMQAPFWRIYLPFDAGGEVCWSGRQIPLQPGSWMLIAPQCQASCSSQGCFRKLYAQFHYALPGVRIRPEVFVGKVRRADLNEIVQAVGTEAQGAASRYRLAHRLLSVTTYALSQLPDSAFEVQPNLPAQVGEALAILEARLDQPPSNEELGRAIGMHANSLLRLFRRHVGTTPQVYGRKLRLAHACVLLADAQRDIDTVASACGFYDRNHFTHAFKRRWGCGPAAFRRQHFNV